MRQGASGAPLDGQRLRYAHRHREERCAGPRVVSATLSGEDAADQLRKHASCCRRIAQNAGPELGATALLAVASHFESDAVRIERQTRAALDGYDNSRERLRAALAQQDQCWPRMGPRNNGDLNG